MQESSHQIGEQLRAARELAGLTLDDVVFQTRLPMSALVALENENFSTFVSPVYAKSFLSQYSSFLKIDASLWLEALKPAAFIDGDPLFPVLELGTPPREEPPPSRGTRSSLMPAIWLLMLSSALLIAAVKGLQYFENRMGSENLPTETPLSKQPAKPEKPSKKLSSVQPTPASPPPVRPPETLAETAVDPYPAEEPTSPAPRAIIVR